MQATQMGKISGDVVHENKCIHAKKYKPSSSCIGTMVVSNLSLIFPLGQTMVSPHPQCIEYLVG